MSASARVRPDESLAAALSQLCDLYALQNLEADKGFFQEHGRLASPICKQITREVNRLCNDLRQRAGEFVDAFGIPDQVLGAPIGLSADNSTRLRPSSVARQILRS